ncbi:MAG: DUF4091 domain-containing protein [Clostridia bacterium]|nr:DUF4091 domain-containing protein [Clostridia bacterium]
MNRKILYLLISVIALTAVIFTVSCKIGNDPATTAEDSVITEAPDDSPAVISGWFDYGSALYRRDKFTPGEASSISVDMAKNEYEGFQYLLTSDKDVDGLRCEVTTLNDGAGHELTGTVNVVYYTYLAKTDATHLRGFYPVAMLPIDDGFVGGSFDVAADTCRTIYVQYKTDADSVPGTYTGKLTVSKDGETVLFGDVSVRVRDVYYEEKTECLTFFGLGYDKEDMNERIGRGPASAPPLGTQQQGGNWDRDLYIEYVDYLLDNRFSSQPPLPDGLVGDNFEEIKKYLDNPRVTAVSLPQDNLAKQYEIAAENGWVDKIYFGAFDEPHEEWHMQTIINNANKVKRSFPTTNFLDAFYMDLPMNGRNIVERMSDYSTVYCPKVDLFQGEIRDTLLRLKAERGDTIFWYNCGEASYDTINMLPCTPGTDKRLLFWQQYQQNVDGYLYWRVTFWNNMADVWDPEYMATMIETKPLSKSTDAPYGDGVLLYWHPVTGKPVSTLGFESVRDGIEDFQLLRMAEREFGRDRILGFAEQLTTDVNKFVKYTEGSTELLAGLRSQIFDLFESAQTAG